MKFRFQVKFTGIRVNGNVGEVVTRTFECVAEDAAAAIEKARTRVKDAKALHGLVRPTYQTKWISDDAVKEKGLPRLEISSAYFTEAQAPTATASATAIVQAASRLSRAQQNTIIQSRVVRPRTRGNF